MQWAELIATAWRQSVDGILNAGQLLIQARDSLEHGEWLDLIKEKLPFRARTAQMLIKIAKDERLTKAKHIALLPPHWATIHEITNLDDQLFEEKIADGTIRPDMERRDIAQTVKKARRAERERELGKAQKALPKAKFGVIVSDPEWRFEPYSRETGMDRAADNHYPTTPKEKLVVRDIPSIAADDCVLFLWATIPMLREALATMKAWGFEYKSQYVWGKDKAGTGYWNREKHELLLIGTKGNPPAPAPGTQRESLILAPRGKHSAKPEIFLEMIEQYYPTLPKIELNRRGEARPGWDAWGNEARIGDESGTNHQPDGTDALAPAAVSEPASVNTQQHQCPAGAGSP